MSGIDRSFRTCSNEYMMTNGESLSDASKTALELGVLLRKAAKRLYWQAGVQLNELVSLTTDSNTDSNVDISLYLSRNGNVIDWGHDTANQLIGRAGVWGYTMWAETACGNETTTYHTHRDENARFNGKSYGTFVTDVLRPTGKVENHLPVLEQIPDPEATEATWDFLKKFTNLTPENIVIEQRGALSDREADQAFGEMGNYINKIARHFKATSEQLNGETGGGVIYKLSDDIRARLTYKPSGILTRTGRPIYSPHIGLSLEQINERGIANGATIGLSAQQMPGGRRFVGAFRYDNDQAGLPKSETLQRNDTLALLLIMGAITEDCDKGRLRKDLYSIKNMQLGALNWMRQPCVELSGEQQETLHDLFQPQ